MSTILVVEDDWDFRHLQQIALEMRGHTVLTAGNGSEALAILAQHRPSVIVLDLMMPVMDGLTFLDVRRRQGDTQGKAVPVVCVSAAGPDLMAEALRRGAVECLAKPTALDRLCHTVDEICARRKTALQ